MRRSDLPFFIGLLIFVALFPMSPVVWIGAAIAAAWLIQDSLRAKAGARAQATRQSAPRG